MHANKKTAPLDLKYYLIFFFFNQELIDAQNSSANSALGRNSSPFTFELPIFARRGS